MSDSSHQKLVSFQNSWKDKFELEQELLKDIFGDIAISIEHIGSTAIESLSAKPIIDIAVLVEERDSADQFTEALTGVGYTYDKVNSSNERHFFRKGTPTEFHLSVTYKSHGSFWERQILFRDYLNTNIQFREEYESLKKELMKKDPTGKKKYIQAKGDFVQKVLELAKSDV